MNLIIKCKANSCLAILACALSVLPSLLNAQVVPADADTSRLRPAPLPLPSVPNFDLRIETPEKSAVPKAVDELTFDITDIVVEGAQQYPKSEVDRLFKPLIGQRAKLSDIREAADKLENRYRQDGFFLVRAFIPPQQVKDGVFRVRVIEGYIESVSAEGGSEAVRTLVEKMLERVVNKRPIDLPTLERALLIMNDMPGVRGSGVLRQGAELGASELVVSIADTPSRSVVIGINNTASKIMGEFATLANLTINNPFEFQPGQLALGLNASADFQRLRALNARYATAIGVDGLVFSIGGLVANARPGGSLKALDIESNSSSISPRFRYALLRGRVTSTYVEAGLSVNHSRTTLLGSELTLDRSTVFDTSLSIVDNRGEGSTEASVGVARGISLFGANGSDAARPSVQGFTPGFTKLRANFVRNQSLPNFFSVQFLSQGQWTADKLLAGEQVFFGGMGLGRGYDSGAVVGDRGAGVLLELRRDILPEHWQGLREGRLQLYVFTDYARAWLLANSSTGSATTSNWLQSVGAGLRYRNDTGLSIDFMVADACRVIQSTDPRSDPRVVILVTKAF
ncbi:MAG: ShlB/FhaC/HecB family hemolysin secretion/activation protein [Burkholderiaceae bacterium]